MALVNYDSGSDSDDPTVAVPSQTSISKPTTEQAPDSSTSSIPLPPPSKNSKKPFQKLVDASGKIKISLGTADQDGTRETPEGPSSKRPRLGEPGKKGESKFSGFNSFLPAPKNRVAQNKAKVASATTSETPTPAKSFSGFKTGAAPGFQRSGEAEHQPRGESSAAEPSLVPGMKPADEVTFTGTPLMFRPLSVTRKAGKKTTKSSKPISTSSQMSGAVVDKAIGPSNSDSCTNSSNSTNSSGIRISSIQPSETKPKKTSLFSVDGLDSSTVEPATTPNQPYEPLFTPLPNSSLYSTAAAATAAETPTMTSQAPPPPASELDVVADDLHLTARQRRELFGRSQKQSGPPSAATATGETQPTLVHFHVDREYQHNEQIRATGEQVHQPLRALQPGKHSLQQMINSVQNQREALEESFSRQKGKQNETGAKYGW